MVRLDCCEAALGGGDADGGPRIALSSLFYGATLASLAAEIFTDIGTRVL